MSFKKIWIFLSLMIVSILSVLPVSAAVGVPPSYDDNFSTYLINGNPDEFWRIETVYNLWINRDKTLMDNIRCLFYPNTYLVPWCESASAWGKFWDVIRYVWFGVLFIYVIMAGIQLLMDSEKADKTKPALKSLIYIGYGAFALFAVTWILGSVLGIETLQWSNALVQKIQGGPGSLMFKVFSFFKALAFFIAIIMMVVAGFKTMAAMDAADKAKKAASWVMNILVSLVFIKVIDYIYYIAQLPQFVSKAKDFILEIGKILGYILGASFVLAIFYAGFLLLTDQWSGDNFKKAKNIIMGIFLAAIVLFLFLLILYQIFWEFTM